MTSIINASTTAGVVVSSDTSGNLAFQTQSGANTITVPNSTGTMMVSGNMPAFSAYMTNGSANLSITPSTWTKAKLDTKEFDTNSNFDSTTNYRFTPTVAGYYQINGTVNVSTAGSLPDGAYCSIYKNGAEFKRGGTNSGAALIGPSSVSSVIYFNGSTDYIELYINAQGGTSTLLVYGQAITYFSGVLVRAA
jgi:hypothetical protein